MTNGAFRSFAEALLDGGYSPLPVVPRSKKPAIKRWSDFCETPMPRRNIRAYGTRYPTMGLAVALGYNGVLALDVDTENPSQVNAICAALPPSPVAKAGAKGFTAFYRAAPGASIPSRHYADARKCGIADLLSVGAGTVLPPSMHPAGCAYRWLTPATLLSVSAHELPEVPADIGTRLEQVLAPWMAKREFKAAYGPRATPPAEQELRRIAAFARAGLRRRTEELAATPEKGRNNALFSLGAGFGRYVFHGVIPAAELEAAALDACKRNGLLDDDSRPAVLATLHSGMSRAQDDPLPVLPERRGM